jgi:D-inositol-3-phosphate glycosyltransferase
VRVAIISYHTSPLAALGSSSAGGMNLYVRRLAEGLAARGVYVDVYTRRDGRHSPPITAFSPGARLISIPAGPERLLNKIELAAYTLPFTRQVAKFVAEESIQYDIIHSHYWLSGLAAQALKTKGQPLVHMFHTLSRVKRLYQPGANASDSPSRDCAEMRLLRADARLVFATGAEIDDVERVYGFRPKSVAIIPPGVDHDRFSPRDAQSARHALGLGSEKVVVCVGRMDRAKGVDALLETAAVLQGASRARAGRNDRELTKTSVVGDYPTGRTETSRSGAEFKVVIVGGNDHRRDGVAAQELARLKAIARDLHISKIVEFRGVVPQEELPLYYAAADVCAVPSRYESFGMVALEAMASGRPVVGFASRGLQQTVRHGRSGLLVPPGDVNGMAAALGHVLSDDALARRMGIAARESVRGFTWDEVVERSLAVYEDSSAVALPVLARSS